MPPRAVYLATSSPRPRRSLGILPSFRRRRRRRPRLGKKRSRSPPLYPFLPDLSLSTARADDDGLRGVDQRACLRDFRVERDDDDAELARELTGCLSLSSFSSSFSSSSSCGLLRTDCCVFLFSNGPDRRSRPPTRRRYRSSSRVCFPVPPPTDAFLVRHTETLLSAPSVWCAIRGFLSLSSSLSAHFPLSSLTRRSRDKGKDYHLTSSGRRTTRLPNRTTTATDSVAASPGVVRGRCRSSRLCLIAAATAVDSGLVQLSAPWRVSARELFRGVGFLGERAARDAIVLPVPVPTADCVPAHTTASSDEDEVPAGARAALSSRSVSRRADATADRDFPTAGSYSWIVSVDRCPPAPHPRADDALGAASEARHGSSRCPDDREAH